MRILGILCLLLTLNGCSSLLFYPEPACRSRRKRPCNTATSPDHRRRREAARLVAAGQARRAAQGHGAAPAWQRRQPGLHLGGSWWLPEQGYQVLLLDYRGYGLSGRRTLVAGGLPGHRRRIRLAGQGPGNQGSR
jgi:hypothetical protein